MPNPSRKKKQSPNPYAANKATTKFYKNKGFKEVYNLRKFPKVNNAIQRSLNEERRRMLGSLYREEGTSMPYKYKFQPIQQKPIIEEEIITEEPGSVIQSRKTSTNGEEPTRLVETPIPRSFNNLYINLNSPNTPEEEAILRGNYNNILRQKYKGGRKTRKQKSRRSTKRRGSRYTRKH